MKARFFKKLSFGLALSAMPFVGGCNQASNTPESLLTAAQAEPSVTAATNVVTPTADLAGPPASESAPVPVPAPNAGKSPLPPNIKPSGPVAQIVKLAQSGVDENVMLTYVSNSTSMFSLGSDEIIYLNDIGTPNSVVTAMIQHDQALKQAWTDAQNATAQANAQAAEAAAPAYVNPPQPEAQPVITDAAPPQEPANVTYNYFYDSLSPYGSWVDVEGYGRCWQPTVVVVNRGWQPYSDRGRWLYTDAGWYWHSDYSWGATAFHYGRWFNHSRWGWCWYPDTVWAPSWVSWRYSNAYCGWAPLPPAACYQPGIGFSYYNSSVGVSFGFGLGANCYTFVSWGNFCDSRPWHHRVPAGHVTQIYNNTTIVNNYGSGNHNTVINRGVPMDHIRRHTGTEIRQVAIRDARNASDRSRRGERLERDGRTLVVNRPNISQGPAITATPTRGASNVQPGRPPAGAGVSAQPETSRSRGREPIATTRNPNITQPASAVSGNTRTTPSTARPVAGSSGSMPRSRDEQSNTLTRDRSRDNNRPATTPSLIVRGGQSADSTLPSPAPQSRTTINPPPTQKAPPGSLIVIGQRNPNSNPGQVRSSNNDRRSTTPRSTQTLPPTQPATPAQSYATAPQTQSQPTRRASAPRSAESLAYNSFPTPAPRVERQEISRQIAPPSRTYSAPVQSAPSPRVQSVSPAYSAPRSAPAPTYSAPRSAPAPAPTPAYSAPRSSPAPAPSYTPAPSRSSSGDARPSSSGGGGGSRR